MAAKSKYLQNLFSFKAFNWFDYLLVVSILTISITSSILRGHFDALGSISALCGVLCVVLGAKGSMANWIFGIIECFLYTYICLKGHIYGDAIQRIVYTLPMQFVGWYLWQQRRRTDVKSLVRTRFMGWKKRFAWMAIIGLCTLLVAYLLQNFGDSVQSLLSTYIMPGKFVKTGYNNEMQLYMDSLTTVISIVAMYVSTRAYVEQWILWIVVNVVSAYMWYQNIDSGDPHAFMTASKYILYFVNSVYGFFMWRRLAKY